MMVSSASSTKPKAMPRLKSRPVDLRDPITVLREEKLITAGDIMRALSTMGRPWTLRQATHWMANDSGIAFQLKRRKRRRRRGQRGGRWYITALAMREKWPHIMDQIEQEKMERAAGGLELWEDDDD